MGHDADVVTTVYVESSTRCNNSCTYIQINILRYNDSGLSGVPVALKTVGARCTLFDCTLRWDKRYTSNGYKRCISCRKGEAR